MNGRAGKVQRATSYPTFFRRANPTPLTILNNQFHHQYRIMSAKHPLGSHADTVASISGLLPMLDPFDPSDKAFELVSVASALTQK